MGRKVTEFVPNTDIVIPDNAVIPLVTDPFGTPVSEYTDVDKFHKASTIRIRDRYQTGLVATTPVGAAALRRFRADFARACYGAGPCDIVLGSHSIGEGWSSSDSRHAWFYQLIRHLASRAGHGTPTRRPLLNPSLGGWTINAGAIAADTSFSTNLWGTSLGVGADISFTTQFDRLIIKSPQKNFFQGAYEIRLDGVLVATHQSYDGALAAFALGDWQTYDSGKLAAGQHTINLKQIVGTGGNFAALVGDVYITDGNGDTNRVRGWNGGHFGLSTASYNNDQTADVGWASNFSSIFPSVTTGPSLVIISHGVNDFSTGDQAAADAFKARLLEVHDYVISKCPSGSPPSLAHVVDMCVSGRSDSAWSLFQQVCHELAEEEGILLVDYYGEWGNVGAAALDVNNVISGDDVHPNDYGHRDIGAMWAEILGVAPAPGHSAAVGPNFIKTYHDVSTAVTPTLFHTGMNIECDNAAAITFTVPPESTSNFPTGTIIPVTQYGAGQVTVTAGAGVTLRSTPGPKTRAQYSRIYVEKRGINEWYVYGDNAA